MAIVIVGFPMKDTQNMTIFQFPIWIYQMVPQPPTPPSPVPPSHAPETPQLRRARGVAFEPHQGPVRQDGT